MRLTKKSEYALKALVELAINNERGITVTLIENIARKEHIPPRYLEQILLRLKNAGILQSKRGVGGGYALNKAPREISVGDVLRAVEGVPSSVSFIFAKDTDAQSDEVSFTLYNIMCEIDNAVRDVVDNISLQEMAQQVMNLIEERKSVPNYVI